MSIHVFEFKNMDEYISFCFIIMKYNDKIVLG